MMIKRKSQEAEPSELIAKIEGYEQTYYISRHGIDGDATSDEALIEIVGRIIRISPKYKHHLNQPIDITLACATTYAAQERTPPSDKPFLLPMRLGKDQRGFMVYLPAAAFWSIGGMLGDGRISHVEARFAPLRYGSGDLLGLYLMPESKLEATPSGPKG